MKELLQKFANTFANQLEKMTLEENEQRSVKHPIIFLFIGDSVKDALKTIININEEKWHNSSGVLYFHAYQTNTITNENVFSFKMPGQGLDRKHIRKSLYEAFYRDETLLIELNKTYRRLVAKLAEYGKVYSSLQKINISVVTSVHDPATILLQEVTLLLKSILRDSSKTVEVDLYGLLNEKQDDENFAFSTSLGISFLHELDMYQQDEYTFEGDLQLTEDGFKMPVGHSAAPLFDLVYLLSDKNENGIISNDVEKQNYEIISNLNLLKNRKLITEYHEKMDSYNHQEFKRNIRGSSNEPVYASAGFAKVRRPNKPIALHAASQFFHELITSLKESSHTHKREKIISLLELSESHFQKYFQDRMPSVQKLEDMNGLMITNSYQTVKKMSVREAEEYLFESGTTIFFSTNFEEPVQEYLQQLDLKESIERCLYENIIQDEKYGLYSAYLWTSDNIDGEFTIMGEIRQMLLETKNDRLKAEAKLEQYYQQSVENCDFKKSLLPFSDKKNLTSFVNYFFDAVYRVKYEILTLDVKEAILNQYQKALEEHHAFLRDKVIGIDQALSVLKQSAAESLYDSDDYLDKNIPEYYGDIIRTITAKLKEKHGTAFISNERFFGNLLSLLENGTHSLIERFITICNTEVLTHEEFHHSFEDELLKRANVRTRYDDGTILTKEDLFKQLYQRMHQNSAIHIEVFNYTQENRHEERYFFGDFYSKLMKFVIEKENETRHFKVGCAHEKKSSGIEKLSLMGGFKLKDLMYYQKGTRYYETYVKNGYEFHADFYQSNTYRTV
ncbi:hypothetical protein [Neobacillus vireti]|uniref:hypothetical protein n=1 Tax=Neobacillus vireti TaxID=220686 RepID=UPI002FFF1373